MDPHPGSNEPLAAPARGLDLGPYRLLLPLGEGGMGEVWAASDTSAPTARVVAIKLSKGAGLQANLHLFDEARLASTIQSANVCRVLEFGEARGFRFLVLEWCDGASLQELLEATPERRLPETVAARIVAEVASGLHAAHELRDESGRLLNVVHRDVSPQNILVGRDGRVVVTDFGIAKALDQKREATETGQVKGKTAYLAPEQIRTKDIDRRADVFALGAVLYTAIVGRKPFLAEDALATIYQILEGEFPKPRELRAEIPEALEAIVLKALALRPEDRFPTMLAFREALEGWLRGVGTRVPAADLRAALEDSVGAKVQARNERVFGALSESEVTVGIDSTGTLTIPQSRLAKPSKPSKASFVARVLLGVALASGLALLVPASRSWLRGDAEAERRPAPAPTRSNPTPSNATSDPPPAATEATSPPRAEPPTTAATSVATPSHESPTTRRTGASPKERPAPLKRDPAPSPKGPPPEKKPTRPLDTMNPFASGAPTQP